MLDIMSDGRLEMGTGRSSSPYQLEAFGTDVATTREQWDEAIKLLPELWTREDFSYQGRFFSWKDKVTVVPKPLQKPHPPLFLPFASSENSIRWAAKEGVTAILPSMLPVYENKLYDVYAEVSGRPRGHGTGLLRDVIIADTDEEAMALWRNSGQFTGRAWFEPFGFRRGLQDPKTGAYLSPEDAVRQGYVLAGTIDTVIRGLEANMNRQAVDWIFCYTYNGLVPHAVLMKSIETFHTKVMPRFA
jgi:alkanesulfonate monooxygenase SsuD/methylene tetrahydromethanopterin reductase-like flavin-dependent oxidoreductase (luciferase family)